jgi:uncharacterized protein
MRFFADEMLGKLARWLRALGVDVSYSISVSDEKILQGAQRERRVVLTRDQKLLKRLQILKIPVLFIRDDRWEDQIRQFFSEYPQLRSMDHALTRCMECNEPLESVSKERVKEKVWPFVYDTQESFSFCRKCDKIYWKATHVEKILRRLEAVIEEKEELKSI